MNRIGRQPHGSKRRGSKRRGSEPCGSEPCSSEPCNSGPRRARTGIVLAALTILVFALTPIGAGLAATPKQPAFDGATIQNPTVLPDFTLDDQSGRAIRLSAARGKLVLLTFLYTKCRDVCPLTAGNLNTALALFAHDRTPLRVYAVSVDPSGDTPRAVRRYIRAHQLRPQFHYLTGTAAELERVWRAYNVASVKRSTGDIDHTLYTLLIDPRGRGRVLYDATALPQQIVHDLRLVSSAER